MDTYVFMRFLNGCVVVLRCSEQNVVVNMLVALVAYIISVSAVRDPPLRLCKGRLPHSMPCPCRSPAMPCC